jgi:hypothetical protein
VDVPAEARYRDPFEGADIGEGSNEALDRLEASWSKGQLPHRIEHSSAFRPVP